MGSNLYETVLSVDIVNFIIQSNMNSIKLLFFVQINYLSDLDM